MMFIDRLLDPVSFGRVITSLMVGVLFIQSGLDKVLDRKGNLSWLTEHFQGSPLHGGVPFLLAIITIVELIAGFGSLAGVGWYLFSGDLMLGKAAAQVACVAILMLFTGQRLAKDYGGAASLIPYFLMTLTAVILYIEWG